MQLERIVVTGGSGFIGTHLISHLAGEGREVLNLDTVRPQQPVKGAWQDVDMNDRGAVLSSISSFRPSAVIHLAARIDLAGTSLEDYLVNTEGTRNVLNAARVSGVGRFMQVSTQFVCQPGYIPVHDSDYAPHTFYGQSKVEGEKMIRSSGIGWVVIRPTTVWGPGDLKYRSQFYRLMSKGWYAHPASKSGRRSYGYVSNVVHQMAFFIDADDGEVAGRTFYVGDPVQDIGNFVDEFSRQLHGHPARRVPAGALKALARAGDVMANLGLKPPLTTQRYRSMTTHYPVPIDTTISLVGQGPLSLEAAVTETIDWLRDSSIIPS